MNGITNPEMNEIVIGTDRDEAHSEDGFIKFM